VDILDPKQVADNLLALEVYFETFHFEALTESPSYPVRLLYILQLTNIGLLKLVFYPAYARGVKRNLQISRGLIL